MVKRIILHEGAVFGELTTIKKVAEDSKSSSKEKWECVCSCKTIINVSTRSLVRKENPTTSCGCKRQKKFGGKHHTDPRQVSFLSLIKRYRNSAKHRNNACVWALSDEEAIILFKNNCFYCGIIPSTSYNVYKTKSGRYTTSNKEQADKSLIYFNGIDRKDSSLGYTVDNSVSCCTTCNYAKHTMSVQDFLSWVKRVVNFQNLKMTRIAHISDTHGIFNLLPQNIDIVLHTGDFVEDPPFGTKYSNYGKIQFEIVLKKLSQIKKMIDNRPFLFVKGNHDFYDEWYFEEVLRNEGIDVHCLHNKIVTIDDVVFYGFPYLPTINGLFACEVDKQTMKQKLEDMVEIINNLDQVDVVATHCGMYKVLDKSTKDGEHYGNPMLEDALFNKIKDENRPNYLAHGHIHSPSLTLYKGMLISNAATRPNILEIN